jgi:replication factor C large subunit
MPKAEEMVGVEEQLHKLEECIRNRKPVILHGPPGVGKTSSVYAVAKKLGYAVIETNASDERRAEELREMLRRVKMKAFRPVIYLFDEVDGVTAGETLKKIALESKHPVVFTANEIWRVPDALKNACVTLKFDPVKLSDVVGRVKALSERLGVKADMSRVSSDVRSSIITSIYGGDKYETLDISDVVEGLFKGKDVDVQKVEFGVLMFWLIDNVHRFYSGKDMFKAIQLLVMADRFRNTGLLSCLPKGRGGKPLYPFYLRRVGAVKGGGV